MKLTVYRLSKIGYGVSKKLALTYEINLVPTILSLLVQQKKKSPLQDFCVADLNSKVLVNGVVCKDPKDVKAEDFLFRGLQRMGNTSNAVGSNVTAVTVNQLAGLNTFGISMARIDFAPWGLNAPHTHPRATEILTVIEGGILFGLIHFQQNVGKGYALAIAGLSSQNPGVITIANAIFGSNPDISRDILAKAFQTNVNVIKQIQSKF
ncbi:putative germin-like protein 2-1 [Tanacetum coccineum]